MELVQRSETSRCGTLRCSLHIFFSFHSLVDVGEIKYKQLTYRMADKLRPASHEKHESILYSSIQQEEETLLQYVI